MLLLIIYFRVWFAKPSRKFNLRVTSSLWSGLFFGSIAQRNASSYSPVTPQFGHTATVVTPDHGQMTGRLGLYLKVVLQLLKIKYCQLLFLWRRGVAFVEVPIIVVLIAQQEILPVISVARKAILLELACLRLQHLHARLQRLLSCINEGFVFWGVTGIKRCYCRIGNFVPTSDAGNTPLVPRVSHYFRYENVRLVFTRFITYYKLSGDPESCQKFVL